MNKKKRLNILLIFLLFMLSAAIYTLQFYLFRDLKDTSFYLLQDMAFLPVQVAIVTVALGAIINKRERSERLSKAHMLTGAFYSELGNEFIAKILPYVYNLADFAPYMNIGPDWKSRRFKSSAAKLKTIYADINCDTNEFSSLKELLTEKRSYMLIILSNPVLLEHESFSNMMWAVFHLTDELNERKCFDALPPEDIAHLNNDVSRAFGEMATNWVYYMDHIKKNYPYLYSLELRKKSVILEKTGREHTPDYAQEHADS